MVMESSSPYSCTAVRVCRNSVTGKNSQAHIFATAAAATFSSLSFARCASSSSPSRQTLLRTTRSTDAIFPLRLSMRTRARQPGTGLEVRMMLLRGFGAQWTNRSRENPHSRSGTLASTAYWGNRRGGGRERVASATLLTDRSPHLGVGNSVQFSKIVAESNVSGENDRET